MRGLTGAWVLGGHSYVPAPLPGLLGLCSLSQGGVLAILARDRTGQWPVYYIGRDSFQSLGAPVLLPRCQGAVLCKASRGMKFEELVEFVKRLTESE